MGVDVVNSQNAIANINQATAYVEKVTADGMIAIENKYKAAAAANRRALGLPSTGSLAGTTSIQPYDRRQGTVSGNESVITNYITDKYSNPRSPYFIKDETTRKATIFNEAQVTVYGYLGRSAFGNDGEVDHRFKNVDYNDSLFVKGELKVPSGSGTEENYQYARALMNKQIRSMFADNNINIPWNTNLRFTINPYNFYVSVTGTDDKDLIGKIEELLNHNKNGMQLFEYLFFSPYDNTQITDEQRKKFYLSNYVRNNAGLTNMSEMTVKDGRFITTDGKDLLSILEAAARKNEVANRDLSYMKELLEHFAEIGYNTHPSINLQVDWKNGDLTSILGYGFSKQA